MTTQRKLVLVAIVAAVVLIGGIALAMRRGAKPGTGAVPPPVSSLPASLPPSAPSGPPTTISADLTAGAPDIDHRVVKPTAGRQAPALRYSYKLMTALPAQQAKTVPVDAFLAVDVDYAKRLAKAYGLPEQEPFIEGTEYSFTGNPFTPGGGILRVNAYSGYSTYTTLLLPPGVRPLNGAADAVRVAQAFLRHTGQLPAKLDPPATYARKSVAGVIFVELHRPWSPLPILETTGMLTASVTDRSLNRPADADVTQTSDRSDGLARPADFNTITVAVDTQARVLAVSANMRPIERTLAARALKTPQQAWDDLTAGKGVLGFTLPSESNITAKRWDEIFPAGVAASDEAQVREVVLAYAEKPDNLRQDYLQPVYIFRGRAKLKSGPLADFVVAVPALADDSLPAGR